jgi:hypothetical protein
MKRDHGIGITNIIKVMPGYRVAQVNVLRIIQHFQRDNVSVVDLRVSIDPPACYGMTGRF